MLELKEGERLIEILKDTNQCPYCLSDTIQTNLFVRIFNLQEVWIYCKTCDKDMLIKYNHKLMKFIFNDVDAFNSNHYHYHIKTIKEFLEMLMDMEYDLYPPKKNPCLKRYLPNGWKNPDFPFIDPFSVEFSDDIY